MGTADAQTERGVKAHLVIVDEAAFVDDAVKEVLIAPLVGFDAAGYRLGYGGGYFDRTLAACSPRPFAIGLGCEESRLDTIHPQSHDIPMDMIVTELAAHTARPAS